jgi:hypothetical protein
MKFAYLKSTVNTYEKLGYSLPRRILANCDKLSMFSQSRKVNSPFGTFRVFHRILKSGKIVRRFSVRGSSVLHNCGGYSINGLRKRLLAI